MRGVYNPRVVNRQRRTAAELVDLDDLLVNITRNEHPLAVKRVFYIAVSAGGVDKTEQGYNVIKRRMLALRRARRVPFAWVTDGTRYILKAKTWNSPEQALEEPARLYRLDLWTTAETVPQIFVEKDAIAGVIESATKPWGVALGVLRGYPSETFAWSVAAELDSDRHHVLYQLGDHDPSGVDAWRAFSDRVGAFAGSGASRSSSNAWQYARADRRMEPADEAHEIHRHAKQELRRQLGGGRRRTDAELARPRHGSHRRSRRPRPARSARSRRSRGTTATPRPRSEVGTMSGRSRRHTPRQARPPRIDPSTVRVIVELDARVKGCTCRYDVEHHGRDRVTIPHDENCPAEHASSSLIAVIKGRWVT